MSTMADHSGAQFKHAEYPVVDTKERSGEARIASVHPLDSRRQLGRAALPESKVPDDEAAILERYGVANAAEAEELLDRQSPLARLVLADKNEHIGALEAEVAAQTQLAQEYLEIIEKMGRDPSTGAINREGWERYLKQHYGISHANIEHVEPHREEHKPVQAVVGVIDVCDLKVVNDNFGHDKGDAMLREAVETMQDLLRDGDPIVRFGGDEFAFLLEVPAGASKHEIEAFKQDIQRRFRERLAQKRAVPLSEMDTSEQPGPIVALGLSSGLMVDYNTYQKMQNEHRESDVTTYHLLLKEADEAMYQDKQELKASGISLPRGGGGTVAPPEADPLLTPSQRDLIEAHDLLMQNIGRVYKKPTAARTARAHRAYQEHKAA